MRTYGSPVILTLFHHANVHTAFEPARLAVTPVVLGNGATAVKGTREGRLALHTAPTSVVYILNSIRKQENRIKIFIY